MPFRLEMREVSGSVKSLIAEVSMQKKLLYRLSKTGLGLIRGCLVQLCSFGISQLCTCHNVIPTEIQKNTQFFFLLLYFSTRILYYCNLQNFHSVFCFTPSSFCYARNYYQYNSSAKHCSRYPCS